MSSCVLQNFILQWLRPLLFRCPCSRPLKAKPVGRQSIVHPTETGAHMDHLITYKLLNNEVPCILKPSQDQLTLVTRKSVVRLGGGVAQRFRGPDLKSGVHGFKSRPRPRLYIDLPTCYVHFLFFISCYFLSGGPVNQHWLAKCISTI